MKNKLRKILISFILTLSLLLSLSGCIVLEGDGTPKTLETPVVSVNEASKIVYWNVVDDADGYYVNVNNQDVQSVKTTFFSYANFEEGTYQIKVKAVPSSLLDTASNYSTAVTVVITEDDTESVDYVELINAITEDVMQANVTVFMGSKKISDNSTSVSQGSGIIYKKADNIQYIIIFAVTAR